MSGRESKVAVVVVAAGSSRRMGFDKLFADLEGKPVLAWTLETFRHHPEIDEVVVVSSPENRQRIASLGLADRIVPGGEQRHHSVRAGLDAVGNGTSWVAVHDGARPLVAAEAITACLDAARRHGAAACARRLSDTVKRADHQGRVIASVDREGLWAMETPQCFALDLLLRAYERVLHCGEVVTDEVSAVQALGEDVFLVEPRSPNPKITFAPDLDLARVLRRALPLS